MCFYENLTAEQAAAYLKRIGQQPPVEHTRGGLHQLLCGHLTAIPFDSIDVWATGNVPSLAIGDLFEKMVIRGRGGYCFEQNTLFRAALNALGFTAYQSAACLLDPDGTPHPPAHNVVICRLEGQKYVLDVGYGGPVPWEPLPLLSGHYDGFSLRVEENTYILERFTEDGAVPFLQFRDIPARISDLEPLNFYISQNPDSHFRHIIHVNRRSPDGSVYAINGNTFKIHCGGQTTSRVIIDVEDLRCILREYYQIEMDAASLREVFQD